MADTKISFATVYVSDQQRALEFYRDLLGFEVFMDDEFMPGFRWLTVGPKGTDVTILIAPATTPMWERENRVGEWADVSLSTDDVDAVDAVYAELSAKSVKFDGEPEDQEWGGRDVQFYGQDGNKFELAQVPDMEGM
ncbi:MAG: VOC family protein [Pirellulaceae bacterium]|jgi:catechol 2,3-dioxygenase-like lactoylglutathione lyase family enzyme|nr:VOC family protein [Pirellulaceae bacterium]